MRAGLSLTLFLLTAELGHNRSSDSEELCSSLHTCHKKWRKEPPAEQIPALPPPAGRTWRMHPCPSMWAKLPAAAGRWSHSLCRCVSGVK